MADKKISQLTAAGTLDETELVPIDQAGTTKAATVAQLLAPARVAFTGDSGAGGAMGMVPAPAAGDAALGRILGAGGNWVDPPDLITTRRNFIAIFEADVPYVSATPPHAFASATIS